MKAATFLNELSHGEIRNWLKSALLGREPLPLLTPDESPYLAVQHLDKELKPPARDSLRDACRELVGSFCAEGQGEPAFLEQLVGLASVFKDPETVAMLADFATRFPKLPELPAEVRLAVLAMLVDTPPPQPPRFWDDILKQDPQRYAALALSGVLATNPEQAIAMLARLPDSERLGQAAALKLDLTWDNLPSKERFQFVQDILAVLPHCGRYFAVPVLAWAGSKKQIRTVATNPSIYAGLRGILGRESSARTLSSRLCACTPA